MEGEDLVHALEVKGEEEMGFANVPGQSEGC